MLYTTRRTNRRMTGALLLAIAVLGGLGLGYWQQLQQEVAYGQKRVIMMIEEQAYLEKYQWHQELTDVEIMYHAQLALFPNLEQPEQLLRHFHTLSEEAGVVITMIKPLNTGETSSFGGEYAVEQGRVEISAMGSWNQLLDFCRLVYQLSPYLVTNSIQLQQGDQSRLGLELTYWYVKR